MNWRASLLVLALAGAVTCAPAMADETVSACDVFGNHTFLAFPASGFSTSSVCPGQPSVSPPGGMSVVVTGSSIPKGRAAKWLTYAPAGLTIASVYVPTMYSYGINDGNGFGGGFYWNGGGVGTTDGERGWSSALKGVSWPAGGSPDFGWQVVCGLSNCQGFNIWLSVEQIKLAVHETVAPTITGTGPLWQNSNWVRGQIPLGYRWTSPSGMCTVIATLNGQSIPGTNWTSGQDPSTWQECGASTTPVWVNTADSAYGNGSMPLIFAGSDAAQRAALAKTVVNVDNVPVSLSLSGPTDVSSTAGTQQITATATAGPSGVAGISCSLDSSPYQWHAGSSASIPVSGIGTHHLSCVAQNNALDITGQPAKSAVQSWALSIRQPTVTSVAFSRVADGLRCTKKHERVRILAHWLKERYHGQVVRVRVPAQTRRVTVVHCHPQVRQRRVLVKGHWVVERVLLFPHVVAATRKRVGFGRSTQVSGWLGTTTGDALGAQHVAVLTAPADETGRFTLAAIATTRANGSWSATLPAGPSRTVEAVYGGSADVEPTTSSLAHLTVPSSVKLKLTPAQTHWGGRIEISGRLRGGFIPSSGELVVLRIGWQGGSTEIGHVYAGRDGRFHASYTFLRGSGSQTYRIWAATARESDYPYQPSHSRRVAVTVT